MIISEGNISSKTLYFLFQDYVENYIFEWYFLKLLCFSFEICLVKWKSVNLYKKGPDEMAAIGMRMMISNSFAPKTRLRMASRLLIMEVIFTSLGFSHAYFCFISILAISKLKLFPVNSYSKESSIKILDSTLIEI